MRMWLWKTLLISLFVFSGCLPTSVAGPDVPEAPDDGTVVVERERDSSDESVAVNDEKETGTDAESETSDIPPDELTDETPDTELPDLDLPPVEVLFDAAIRPAVLAELGRAQEEVLFTTFTFSDGDILAKLNALASHGVDVRGVVGAPVEAGEPHFPVRSYTDEGNGIMHEKFFLIDGATALISSGNIAYQNIRNDLIVVRNDPVLVSALKTEFSQLEQEGVRGTAKTSVCPPPEGCAIRDGSLFFSPGACDVVSSLIESIPAGTTASLLMYGITDSAPMYDVLKDLPVRGVTLRVLLDDWVGEGGTVANELVFEELAAAGATVSYYEGDMVFHHKIFLTSDIALFGSMNWTYAGCLLNDEVLFLSSDAAILDAFDAYTEEVLP